MWWDVEDGTWIGAEATLMDGVRVRAGAVVTGDTPPHVLAIGAPAQVVRWLGTEAEMQREIFEAVRGKTRLSHAMVTDCGREI
jgi:serine acetyltransferase